MPFAALAVLPKRKIFAILVAITIVSVIAYSIFVIFFKTVSINEQRAFVDRSNQLSSQGKYGEVEELVNAHLENRLNAQQYTETAFIMAINLVNQDKLSEARDWYLKAQSDAPGKAFAVAESLAAISLRLGDLDSALRYYKESIEIAKSDQDPLNDEVIISYENIVKKLEAGESLSNPPLPNWVNSND